MQGTASCFVAGSLFLPSLTKTSEDTLRKLREDPLFIIRQAEAQQKRDVLTNPLLRPQVATPDKDKKAKKAKKEKKEKKAKRDREREPKQEPSLAVKREPRPPSKSPPRRDREREDRDRRGGRR